MKEIYVENIASLLRNKRIVEKQLKVKIDNRGKNVFVDGKAENEYLALSVIEAIDLGFSIERALMLKNENIILQTIYIKDITKRKDITQVKARVIGTHGKTLKNLNNLSDCAISLYDNKIGIIGFAEDVDDAIISLKSLIQGSKQSHVYSRLEREKKKKRLDPAFSRNIKNEYIE